MVGIISQQSIRNGSGTSIYLDDKGWKWEVSAVYQTLKEAEEDFRWPDATVVSNNLVEFIGVGRPCTNETKMIEGENEIKRHNP